MKQTILTTITIFLFMSCKAQNIIPIEQQINYRIDEIEVPDGTYYKDINNILDKYTGTWVGNQNNYNLTVVVTKVTQQGRVRTSLQFDKLLIRYKITDNSGNTIIDTTPLPDDNSPLIIKGSYLDTNGETYHLSYLGGNSICGQNGYIAIAVFNNDTQMNFLYTVKGEMYPSECPNGQAVQILPTTNIVLTKQ